MSDEQMVAPTELTPAQVEAYLQTHPEFFHQHLALLENMSIPHPSGNAVSLISKQLEIFRGKHQELESQLTALIEIAKDNDITLNQMHELTLALMEAHTVKELEINLDKVFSECFLTDFSAIRIFRQDADSFDTETVVNIDNDNLHHFTEILSSNQPKCGRPTLPQANFLFGDEATEIKSCAIVPMVYTELEGVIAIGSKDDSRFHYSMGNLFLTQMSEVIATRLIAILN